MANCDGIIMNFKILHFLLYASVVGYAIDSCIWSSRPTKGVKYINISNS